MFSFFVNKLYEFHRNKIMSKIFKEKENLATFFFTIYLMKIQA